MRRNGGLPVHERLEGLWETGGASEGGAPVSLSERTGVLPVSGGEYTWADWHVLPVFWRGARVSPVRAVHVGP